MSNSVDYNRSYFIINKEKIMEKRRENPNYNKWQKKIHICACGLEYKSDYYYTHRKKCKSYLTKKNQSSEQNQLRSQDISN